MTTASVLITVSTAWSAPNSKCDLYDIDDKFGKTRDVAAVAASELRETPATRDQALRIMREWITQNPDVKNVRIDDSFLLRFLRHKKFSILMAQQTLLKYLNLRQYYNCFANLDCKDSSMEEIINSGYISVSPVRDSKGRRIIVYDIANIDARKYNCWDMVRVHCIIYESVMENDVDQVCGFVHVGNAAGATGNHITLWNPIDFARLIKWGEQSLPMRHKEFHIINLPSAVKYVVDFAISKVTTKMADRLTIHTSPDRLREIIDIKCLPTSFGGLIPQKEIIDFTKRLVQGQRQNVVDLDNMRILSTRGIISSRNKGNKNGDVLSIQGSFRKLDID